ncbi:unannotated protein [freshwater metagenome]|uniref:Unannotated protein n=1 Tax=freshwater metagenome TaxID=449393 RepID=A0A6J7H1I9_9ZZZZ
MAAVAVRDLVQVCLVVRLGVEERDLAADQGAAERGRPRAAVADLRRDRAVAGVGQRPAVVHLRRLGLLELLVRGRVDRGAVRRPHVVALAHALRRVVALPEAAQELLERRLLRVPHHEDGLRVVRAVRADLAVRRVRRLSALVAHGGDEDPGRRPERALGAPEAAHPEGRVLRALRERRDDGPREHRVDAVDRHELLAAGEGVLGGDEGVGLAAEEHGVPAGREGVRAPLRRAANGSCRAYRGRQPGQAGRPVRPLCRTGVHPLHGCAPKAYDGAR